MSDATAARIRNGAATGIESRSDSFDVPSDTTSAALASRITAPNVVASCMPRRYRRERNLLTIPSVGAYFASEYLRHSMRRLILIPLVLALLVPAIASAGSQATLSPGDGSFVTTDAGGRVIVTGRGLIYGHISAGTITVLSYTSDDGSPPQLSAKSRSTVAGSFGAYTGTDVRFFFPSGRYSLQIDGGGIGVSAVGRGSVALVGDPALSDFGVYSINGGKGLPLQRTVTIITFGNAR